MSKASLRVAAIVMALALCSACGSPDLSPADQFREDQAATVTPHGPIDLKSVKGNANGEIDYVTADGTPWVTRPSAAPDGTHRYDAPTRRAD